MNLDSKKDDLKLSNEEGTDNEKTSEVKIASTEGSDRNSLLPNDEMKILKHWGLLKKTLVVGRIIDPLIEKGIITPEKWMSLKKNEKSDPDTAEDFMYILLKSHPDAYDIFLKALNAHGYSHLAGQLEGHSAEDTSSSISSGGSSQNRQIGRPPSISHARIFPRQTIHMHIPDPRNGASGDVRNLVPVDELERGATSSLHHVPDNTVRQEDLDKMKQEITEELRQLRANIERDRDQDRLELKILQRKHTELQDDLAKTKDDREQLQSELRAVTENVQGLKDQIERKQAEYREVQEKNKQLEEQLQHRSGHLEKQIRDKEREKNELMKALKNKEGEYRQLQNAMEKLKEEHEERHNRLKNLTKDKVTLEKEVQILNKDKRNLEVKIKSLEQHIRVLQESYTRETGEIKHQLDKQKTLLEEKERERIDLEKKLEERVRENENLKRTNLDLEESLQKTQDEKAHLQQKLHRADMSRYALPPFLAGSKSTRTGWNPKNLRR